MKEAYECLKSEFECEIEVISADKNDVPKAKSAISGKRGILV
jgi:hypothetical protein